MYLVLFVWLNFPPHVLDQNIDSDSRAKLRLTRKLFRINCYCVPDSIRKLAGGVYTFLRLGFRALRKVEQIVREEMDRAGAH